MSQITIHQNITGPYGVMTVILPNSTIYIPIADYGSVVCGDSGKALGYRTPEACNKFLDSLEALKSAGGVKVAFTSIPVPQWIKQGLGNIQKASGRVSEASPSNDQKPQATILRPRKLKAKKLSTEAPAVDLEIEARVKMANLQAAERRARLRELSTDGIVKP